MKILSWTVTASARVVVGFSLLCAMERPAGAQAASPVHRISFQIDGSGCRTQRNALSQSIQALPGVIAVDWSSVPGHVLIDLDLRSATVRDVQAAAAQAAGPACDMRPMASCISPMDAGSTAAMPSASTSADPHQ